MKEHLRDNYFLAIKILINLTLMTNIIIVYDVSSGVSVLMLLLFACFLSVSVGYEMMDEKKKALLFVLETVFAIIPILLYTDIFSLLLSIVILDLVSSDRINVSKYWYLSGYLPLLYIKEEKLNHTLLITFLIIIYFQYGVIVKSYSKQMNVNEQTEQKLKSKIIKKDVFYQEEIKKNLLHAENSILNEKARLSQELHDKLGHSINGSLYQLEACKVLLDKDTKDCSNILTAVIDNLRKSMDEIREILRRERPDKNKLFLMQFQQLCDDCRKAGIEADFITEGNLSVIPDKIMEIILDNTVEAISNSLKYSRCTRIEIKIIVLNQLIRCTLSDNGIGCDDIIDGMGIGGMRRRVRSVNGVLDFESETGFTINMLLPFINN